MRSTPNAVPSVVVRAARSALLFIAVSALPVAGQVQYAGRDVTGALVLTGTVNLQQVQVVTSASLLTDSNATEPVPISKQLPRPVMPTVQTSVTNAVTTAVKTVSLTAIASPAAVQFNGLTHMDQRLANGGNQFSVEPPNPSIASGNGFVLEGVNNAIQVYDATGRPLLPAVVSSNQLFGVPAAINRTTGVYGVFPTDMRVFFDATISRWFVLQRAQDFNSSGAPLNSSHIYMAVSQTADPTTTYNVYTMNTTESALAGCPCLWDYPQIGADQFGFYISANKYNTSTLSFVNATILAISKGALASGGSAPAAFEFVVPVGSGFEFTIQPATTPPGASNFVANGGVEFFASTAISSTGNQVAVWAMSNTSSLTLGNPNPTLTESLFPTLNYALPDIATQPEGLRPYGQSLTPPGLLPFLDGGDTRALSLSYAGGRLYLTFATKVTDPINGTNLVGGAYVIFSPTIRNGVLDAPVLDQSYLIVENNHLLRPTIAVNALGQGAIAATLVGPNWYPSGAYVPITGPPTTPSTILIPAPGGMPEDGFSGYPGGGAQGVARWGDYSSVTISSDGSVWMAQEYIGNLPRTQLANWDTFIESIAPPVTTTGTLSPIPVAANPPAGSGASQVFSFTFSDGAGWQTLGVVNVLLNKALDGRRACYLAYVVPSNTLYLVDDAGDAGGPFAGSLVLNGSAGSASNSQCSINGAKSSAVGNGQVLTLTLSITFSSGFAGNNVMYMAARDTGTGNSGWQALGTWNMPAPASNGPAVGGVTPPRSGSRSDAYSFTFTDTNGWADIAVANILVNSSIDGRHACYLAFVPSGASSGSVYLVDDAGDAGGPFAAMLLPGTGTAANSQCTVSASGASVSGTGNTLTLTLPITFSQSFGGNKVFFLATRSNTMNSNWQAVGTVTVPQ